MKARGPKTVGNCCKKGYQEKEGKTSINEHEQTDEKNRKAQNRKEFRIYKLNRTPKVIFQ